jgi:RNA recognition motif-containing protein
LENVKDLTKKIFVGNLNFDTSEEQVNDLLGQYGKIESVAMITDRDSGRFRGFCFVEMEDSAANAAINALNDTMFDGRNLRVNEALPREDNRGGGGGNQGNKRRQNKFPHSGGGNRW